MTVVTVQTTYSLVDFDYESGMVMTRAWDDVSQSWERSIITER
jgi:hypothetical protein